MLEFLKTAAAAVVLLAILLGWLLILLVLVARFAPTWAPVTWVLAIVVTGAAVVRLVYEAVKSRRG